MTNFNKRFAFTLSELLLSLIIVGVVAIITVPVLINNVQKKLFATQVKNMVANIEQVAQDELLAHRTRDLSNTDFADPELLLSDKHFKIAKSCSAQTALRDCWKTTTTGKDKVSYKSLSKASIFTDTIWSAPTLILKNGVILSYFDDSIPATRRGYFYIDVNGNDKPNIYGRDFFYFHMSPVGRAIGKTEVWDHGNPSLATLKSWCFSSDPNLYPMCYDYLYKNNWKMDY